MNNAKRKRTIANKQAKSKDAVLEQLRKCPIVHVACEKAGIGRQTYYRWRQRSRRFTGLADKAINDGEDFLNDLSEYQLISLMKDKSWPAIRFWLEKRHPKFNKTKMEIAQPIEVSFLYDQKN